MSLSHWCLAGLIGLAGCSHFTARPPRDAPAPRPSPVLAVKKQPSHPTERLILITIDGVRWQDVFGGVDPELARKAGMGERILVDAPHLLPNLYGLASRGIVAGAPGHGPPMHATGPNYVSLPGYLEIFTGAPSTCPGNLCWPDPSPTFLDKLRDQIATDDTDVVVFSSWERYALAVSSKKHFVVSAGKSSGATRQSALFDNYAALMELVVAGSPAAPGFLDYRADPYTGNLARYYLEHMSPKVLVIGLGDTDEYAHKNDYLGYIAALQNADQLIGHLVRQLKEKGQLDTTTILVTTDHGRAWSFSDHDDTYPESSRVWLFGAGGQIDAQGYLERGEFKHLSDIAPFVLNLFNREKRGSHGHL